MGFIDLLTNITYATNKQKEKELWDVEGILKNQTNRLLKFDLRPLINNTKKGSLKTKADKMVFDLNNQYILIDIEEIHLYIKQNKLKEVHLESLIDKLDWNIVINK